MSYGVCKHVINNQVGLLLLATFPIFHVISNMDFTSYIYVMGFPVTVTNCIWVIMTPLLLLGCVSNFLIQPQYFVGTFLKYLLEYGKFKSVDQRFDVPKRFFLHYYIFASAWNLICFLTIVGLSFGIIQYNWIAELFRLHGSHHPQGDQLSIIMVIAMLTIQSFRRLYECLFVSVFSSKAKLNIIQYIWGFVYYFSLAPTLISECLMLNKLPFGSFQFRHFIGISGFIIASFIHHQSHVILANLRKTGEVKQEGHGMPTGGLFHFVSCPHYFAEILVYLFALVIVRSQCHSWWLVVSYNLVVHAGMAMGSHQWYQKTFSNYPKKRKAFIPYLF